VKETGKAGIREVAEAAGVSRTAVSLVLNRGQIRISDEKRKAIWETAARLGYRPHIGARRLARNKTDTIGLVFPYASRALSQPFLFELTREIADAARSKQYDVLLDFVHSDDPDSFPSAPGRVDGAILIRERSAPSRFMEELSRSRLPFVTIGAPIGGAQQEGVIDIDVRAGARELADHLISLGHRHIAYVATIPSPLKFAGYEEALTGAGLQPSSLFVADGPPQSSAQTLVDRVMNTSPTPTAIMAVNDTLAISVMNVLHRKGIHVPEDISVAGFDDTQTAALVYPSLTTVHIPIEELARAAVGSLVAFIDGEPKRMLEGMLPTWLVPRESTGSVGRAVKDGG